MPPTSNPKDKPHSSLESAIASYRDAIVRGGLVSPSTDDLLRRYNGEPKESTFEAALSDDRAVLRRAQSFVFETYKIFPVRPLDKRVSAALAISFCETLGGLYGHSGLQSVFVEYGAVPLMRIGPAFVVGHFDPSFPFNKFLPPALCIPVWLSFGDYRALREDLAAQMSLSGGWTALRPTPVSSPSTYEQFAVGRTINQHAPELDLRVFAEWVLTLPNLDSSDAESMQGLLGRDAPIALDSLPTDIRLLALRTVLFQIVLKTDNIAIARDADSELPPSLLGDHQICPLLITDRFLFVIHDQQASFKLDDDCYNRAGLKAVVVVVPPEQFHRACTTESTGVVIQLATANDNSEEDQPDITLNVGEYSSTPPESTLAEPETLVRFILYLGGSERASDVHVDYFRGMCRVRFTIDGVAREVLTVPGNVHDSLASRLKTYSKIPLDAIDARPGRFSFAIGSRKFDVRTQLLFNHKGKARFVLRLLDKSQPFHDVASLGLTAAEINALQDVYRSNQGIMFVCGATGQGKTTTIHSILSELNQPDQIIFALEDPPELELPGVTQITCTAEEVSKYANIPTFSEALEDLLRSAPTVISIGEVRDRATADVAIRAALTGHFVITSMHTSTVFVSLLRLANLKIDPVDFASTARMFVCQRLLRRVCRCHRLEPITDAQREYLEDAGVEIPDNRQKLPVAVGCPQCGHTGYFGRILALEMLRVSATIEGLILRFAKEQVTLDDIKVAAKEEGYRPILHNALSKVVMGMTTLAEVDRSVVRAERVNRASIGVTRAPFSTAA